MIRNYKAGPKVPAKNTFSWLSIRLFFLISVYLVFPLVEVPLIGLSFSAVLFLFVVAEAILKPPVKWSSAYRPFIGFASLILIGIFLSMIINGFASGGAEVDSLGIRTVINYAYWLLIFIVVAYVVNAGGVAPVLTRLLGWSILILAVLRWWEAITYGTIGAEFYLQVMTQNSYGFQFSAFSPFLLGLALTEQGWKKNIAILGNILLWGAVAINGSRGSWVGIGISTLMFLVILLAARQRVFGRLSVLLVIIGSLAFLIFSSSPVVLRAVTGRLNTFQTLNEEKSYAIRTLMNQKALRLFEQSPYVGVGPGRFTVSSIELDIPQVLSYANQEHFDRKSAHNSYLSFLAENGLSGGIPLGLLLIYLAMVGLKAAISLVRQNQYWGAAIYAGFIGMSVHMWVVSALTGTVTWYIYGLVSAMIILSRSGLPESKK